MTAINTFNISQFEAVFYIMLYREYTLDMVEFNRKICYNGRIYRVIMRDSRIIQIIDLSNIEPIIVYGNKLDFEEVTQ